MLVAALLLAIPCAHAQSGKPLLSDTYAVTASRGAQPIADVLADVTVIDVATSTVERRIPTGGSPWGIAIK